MAKKRARRSRRRGLGYPSQPCGLSYKDFRGGWTYADAYEMVAYGRGDTPRTVTQNVVRRMLAKLKRDEYDRYNDDCTGGATSGLGATRTRAANPAQTTFPFMQKEQFRRRAKSAGKKECSIEGHVRTCETDAGPEFMYVTSGDRREIATLYLYTGRHWNPATGRNENLATVGGVEVANNHLGSGVGTKLYEAALRWARRGDMRLASDKIRSEFSEAFWRKQESKGRATCFDTERNGQYYSWPMQNIRSKCERGSIPKAQCDKILTRSFPKPLGSYSGAYWPCGRWALKSTSITELGRTT